MYGISGDTCCVTCDGVYLVGTPDPQAYQIRTPQIRAQGHAEESDEVESLPDPTEDDSSGPARIAIRSWPGFGV